LSDACPTETGLYSSSLASDSKILNHLEDPHHLIASARHQFACSLSIDQIHSNSCFEYSMKHISGRQRSQPVAVGVSHRHFLAHSRCSHLRFIVEFSKRAASRQWWVCYDGFAAMVLLRHLELDIIDLAPLIP
jgi:hypothetical protein